jgi:hypothetical protein
VRSALEVRPRAFSSSTLSKEDVAESACLAIHVPEIARSKAGHAEDERFRRQGLLASAGVLLRLVSLAASFLPAHGILTSPKGLSLTDAQVTAAATTYLAGAVFGALLFGYLTDLLGRKRLFLVTVPPTPWLP